MVSNNPPLIRRICILFPLEIHYATPEQLVYWIIGAIITICQSQTLMLLIGKPSTMFAANFLWVSMGGFLNSGLGIFELSTCFDTEVGKKVMRALPAIIATRRVPTC